MAGTLDQQWTTQNQTAGIGVNSNLVYVSQGFTSELDGEIDQVDLYMKKVNSPTMTIYIGIWSDDGGGEPNALLSDEVAFDTSTLTSSLAWKTFVFSSPATASNETEQHIVIRAGTTDGTNYAEWGNNSAGGYAGGAAYRSADAVTWVAHLGGGDFDFKTYVTEAGGDTGGEFMAFFN